MVWTAIQLCVFIRVLGAKKFPIGLAYRKVIEKGLDQDNYCINCYHHSLKVFSIFRAP